VKRRAGQVQEATEAQAVLVALAGPAGCSVAARAIFSRCSTGCRR